MEMKDDAVSKQFFIGSQPVYMAADFNPAQLAQWTWDEQVFSFLVGNKDYYPAFQFDGNRQPLAIMQKVLPKLASRLTNWQITLWFTEQNPDLGGHRPVDLLASRPDAVWWAARSEASRAQRT